MSTTLEQTADVELTDGGRVGGIGLLDLGRDLLEGIELTGCPSFESWLLVERHRLSRAVEAQLVRRARRRGQQAAPAVDEQRLAGRPERPTAGIRGEFRTSRP